MDIRKFLSTQSKNNTLEVAIEGFEKSSFVEQSKDVATLMRSLLMEMIRSSLTNTTFNPAITPVSPPCSSKLHMFVKTSGKLNDNSAPYLNQHQSGGISPNKNNKASTQCNITSLFVEVDENNEIDTESEEYEQNKGKLINPIQRKSYCTVFDQLIYNIQGLLGSEFSKFLFVIAGNKQLISNEITCISKTMDYQSIVYHLKRIKALLEIADVNMRPTKTTNEFYDDDKEAIDISNELWNYLYTCTNKRFICPELIENTAADPINNRSIFTAPWNPDIPTQVQNHMSQTYFNYNSTATSKKTKFIDYIIKRVTEVIESDNILMFYEDRDSIIELLNVMLKNITYGKYYVNNVDDLVINLGCNGFVYDKSFLKMFEIFFKESFADIPAEFWQPVFDPNCTDMSIDNFIPPYAQYIKNELKMDIKIEKYIDTFTKYYNKIFVETIQCAHEKLNKDSMLGVVVTNECYALLAHITFNLFVNLSKRIANEQVTLTFFNKSSRIQFKQVFSALMDCTPHNMIFSCSQRMMLHYVLLSRKTLYESAKNCNELPSTGKKSTKKKIKSESDSESEEEEIIEVKKRRGRTPAAKKDDKNTKKSSDKTSKKKDSVKNNKKNETVKRKRVVKTIVVEERVETESESEGTVEKESVNEIENVPEQIVFNEVIEHNIVESVDDVSNDDVEVKDEPEVDVEELNLDALVDGILEGF